MSCDDGAQCYEDLKNFGLLVGMRRHFIACVPYGIGCPAGNSMVQVTVLAESCGNQGDVFMKEKKKRFVAHTCKATGADLKIS